MIEQYTTHICIYSREIRNSFNQFFQYKHVPIFPKHNKNVLLTNTEKHKIVKTQNPLSHSLNNKNKIQVDHELTVYTNNKWCNTKHSQKLKNPPN